MTDNEPLSVVIAGGGTAGHIEPALATADAIRRQAPDTQITFLGTARGLETSLVPERGYDLELIPPVPLPRKISLDLLRLPLRLVSSIVRTRQILRTLSADVTIGFGGYVSVPAYLASALSVWGRIPVVVHEANARAGLGNRLGARLATKVLAAVPDSGLNATIVGIPVRDEIVSLDREALRLSAREYFGLDPQAPLLLVFGGSQGAQNLNRVMADAREGLAALGVGVLHAVGPKNFMGEGERQEVQPSGAKPQIEVPYLHRMDLAYAAADLAMTRAGAMTVAEVSAVGLPAIYVPLGHGNGEQELNARPVVDAGGGMIVEDAQLSASDVVDWVASMLNDSDALSEASDAATRAGSKNAASTLADIVLDIGCTTQKKGK